MSGSGCGTMIAVIMVLGAIALVATSISQESYTRGYRAGVCSVKGGEVAVMGDDFTCVKRNDEPAQGGI